MLQANARRAHSLIVQPVSVSVLMVMLTLVVVCVGTVHSSTAVPSGIGVQWDGRWSPQNGSVRPLPGVATEMWETGSDWVRVMVPWAQVEQVRGVYNWTSLDAWVNGMGRPSPDPRPRLILTPVNSGAGTATKPVHTANPLYDHGDSPHSSEAVSAYAQFAAAVADHFAGTVAPDSCVEIDNEPDGNWQHGGVHNGSNGFNDGVEYGRMAAAAVAAIRAQALVSDTPVLTCVLVGSLTTWRCSPSAKTGANNNCAFLNGTLHAAPTLLTPSVTAWTLHPYGERPASLDRVYDFLRTAMMASGHSTSVPPLLCGEVGFKTTDPDGVTDVAEAAGVANLLLANTVSNVSLTVLYEFPDRLPPTPRNQQCATCYMGLVYQPYNATAASMGQAPLKPKPAFHAMKTFATQTYGMHYTGVHSTVPYGSPGSQFLLTVFSSDGTVGDAHGKDHHGVTGQTHLGSLPVMGPMDMWVLQPNVSSGFINLTHTPGVARCYTLTSHVGAQQMVCASEPNASLSLPIQPSQPLVYLEQMDARAGPFLNS